jgi:hypothetical protein
MLIDCNIKCKTSEIKLNTIKKAQINDKHFHKTKAKIRVIKNIKNMFIYIILYIKVKLKTIK